MDSKHSDPHNPSQSPALIRERHRQRKEQRIAQQRLGLAGFYSRAAAAADEQQAADWRRVPHFV